MSDSPARPNAHLMKAICRSVYGPPEVLEIRDVPVPEIKEDQVLIKVHVTTINRTDMGLLKASPFVTRFMTGLRRPKNPIMGSDFAGEVVEIGPKVSDLNVGDRVCGFGDSGELGSHAEFTAVSVHKVRIIPHELDYQTAVACMEGAHYAFNFINKVKLTAGDRLLVNGVTGAIGSALLQLLQEFDVHITAVCGSDQVAWARSRGANQVIDYETDDFTEKEASYDYIFDAVGKSSYNACRKLLNPGGAYVTSELAKPVARTILQFLTTPVFSKVKAVLAIPTSMEGLSHTLNLASSGKFIPLIDRRYAMDQATEGYTYVAGKMKLGNVLLIIKG